MLTYDWTKNGGQVIPVHGSSGTVYWPILPVGARGFDSFTRLDKQFEVKFKISDKDKVALDPEVTAFKVVFGDMYWGVECDFEGIEAIYQFVAESVIPRFAGFFK